MSKRKEKLGRLKHLKIYWYHNRGRIIDVLLIIGCIFIIVIFGIAVFYRG